MEDRRYLSGAQDLYLSPGCLKLFSFSIMHCINQQLQCELLYKCFHVFFIKLSKLIKSNLGNKKKNPTFLLVEERRRREKEKKMQFCFLFMFLIMLLRRPSTSCTVRIR